MSLIEQPTIFERIVTANDVEQWVVALLRKWSGTYISELERQHGYAAGTLARVKGWTLATTFDKWPEDQVPGLLVVSPGLIPPPVKSGGGVYRATWRVDVGCLCSARTMQQSHEQAQLMIAAHKSIVAQKPSLEGHAIGAAWVDETYDPLDFDDTRSLYAGYASFAIEVDNVLTTLAGPLTPDEPLDPDTDPWPLWPTVETFDVEIDKQPIDTTKED
jgi:hypothetical protein